MREIDDAKIRTEAVFIEAESHVLYQRAQELHKRLEYLKAELPHADPISDREFDLFLLELSRSVIALQSLADLKEAAKAMQKFRLPFVEAVVPTPFQSVVPHGVRQEVVHA
jgi:hypothetical protein